MEIVEFGPNDVLILKNPCSKSPEFFDGLRDCLKPALGERVIIVLDGGIDCELWRNARIEPVAEPDAQLEDNRELFAQILSEWRKQNAQASGVRF